MKPHKPQHEHQQFRRAAPPQPAPAPYRPEDNQYPAVVVHPTDGKKTVASREEHVALGQGWDFAGHEKQE